MLKFYSKVLRVNEMGGKFYVEVNVKAFNKGEEAPAVNTSEVKVFNTADEASKFIASQ